ncbi:hypothetical protein [Haloarcula japonica]|uniref:Uncharacterized protein n=1 Tax=Haloarcula japonica (strain ATCC 49778 / DSM 6131 / JCM 7785 / NBRC 101032 / NCIMB 13157 / TR-1) TaxID=1227453 RepID=M0L9D0_HALJT|nr:hypothetical protein [Haloarcula japonica]EMA30207.1 hypothetical protein C444_10004 [Haloarcula japonica DSM 6131]
MATRQRQRFIYGHLTWVLGTILVLTLLDALTLELFFVVSLIGFLVTVELVAPQAVSPRWRRRLWWLIGLGLVGFAYVVIKRILEILPPGLI